MTTMTLIENPLKTLRLQLNYSLEGFAKQAGIQLSAVAQAEEGFYSDPLPAYLSAVGIKPGTQEEFEITNEYHAYQLAKRQSNGPITNNSRLTLNPSFFTIEHPLLTWRNQSALSTYGFCSAFCIHMGAVNNFEKKIRAVIDIPPKSILKPLLDAGYGEIDVLDEFIEACKLHKAHLINHSRRLNNLPLLNSEGNNLPPVGST